MRRRFRLRRAGRRRSDDESRVLPLINVVFLLLVFFMVVGRLEAAPPFAVDPPRARRGAPVQEPDALVVHLNADGRTALGGVVLDDPAQLAERLALRLEGRPERRVRLVADAGADAGEVVRRIEALREAGARRVRLVTVAASP